jgi:hypothetical protein
MPGEPSRGSPGVGGATYVRRLRALRALFTPAVGASPSSASRARIARRAPSESPAASAASRAARNTAVAWTRGLAAVSAAVSVDPSRSCRVSVARPGFAGLRSPIGSIRPPRSCLTPAVSCSIRSISSHPEGDASRPPSRPGLAAENLGAPGLPPRTEARGRLRRGRSLAEPAKAHGARGCPVARPGTNLSPREDKKKTRATRTSGGARSTLQRAARPWSREHATRTPPARCSFRCEFAAGRARSFQNCKSEAKSAVQRCDVRG